MRENPVTLNACSGERGLVGVLEEKDACLVIMVIVAALVVSLALLLLWRLFKGGVACGREARPCAHDAAQTRYRQGSTGGKNNKKNSHAPLARRRAHACRASSRALSNAPPHRTQAYAPALTAWMCRWNVSARTPPSSSPHPRRGQRSRPSVRGLRSIVSVASSLCPHHHQTKSKSKNKGGDSRPPRARP